MQERSCINVPSLSKDEVPLDTGYNEFLSGGSVVSDFLVLQSLGVSDQPGRLVRIRVLCHDGRNVGDDGALRVPERMDETVNVCSTTSA